MEQLIILKNVHIYLVHPYFFVAPTVEMPNGTWVEVDPVTKVDVMDLDNLASSIENASQLVIKQNGIKSWDGENKMVWTEATSFWTIHWYTNGTICITPHFKLPVEIDDETGELLDGGWEKSKEREISNFSPQTPFSQLARTILLSA